MRGGSEGRREGREEEKEINLLYYTRFNDYTYIYPIIHVNMYMYIHSPSPHTLIQPKQCDSTKLCHLGLELHVHVDVGGCNNELVLHRVTTILSPTD